MTANFNLKSFMTDEEIKKLYKRRDKYILDKDKNPIPANLMEWSGFFEDMNNRRVKEDYIGKFFVSTVFLGIDHQWEKGEEPHIFETMVFPENNMNELWCKRCGTWQDAEKCHQEAIDWINNGCKEDD